MQELYGRALVLWEYRHACALYRSWTKLDFLVDGEAISRLDGSFEGWIFLGLCYASRSFRRVNSESRDGSFTGPYHADWYGFLGFEDVAECG